jgi:replicative DNA helicase
MMATAEIPQSEPLPFNIEAEAALLGALMIDNRLVERIADKLRPEHFFEPLHGRIYTAILARAQLDRRADPVTLEAVFRRRPAMKELAAVRLSCSADRLRRRGDRRDDFADQVRELAQRRALIGA